MKRLSRHVTRALVATVLAVGIAVAALLVAFPRLTGGAALTVLSGSMTPTYPVGSVVFVQPVDPADVRAGDVITFANDDGRSFTTHRVVEIEHTPDGRQFVTKGDANRGVDPDPVVDEAVRGRVSFNVPYLGRVRDAIATPWGLSTIASLAALSLASDHIRQLARRARRGTRPGTTEQARLSPAPAATVEAPTSGDVEQQLLLVRLASGDGSRGRVSELMELVRGHVIAVEAAHLVVAVSGTPHHLDGVERLLAPFTIVESHRSPTLRVNCDPNDTEARSEVDEEGHRDHAPSSSPSREVPSLAGAGLSSPHCTVEGGAQ